MTATVERDKPEDWDDTTEPAPAPLVEIRSVTFTCRCWGDHASDCPVGAALWLLTEVERLTALVNAKQSWIDGAKVDLDAAITWQDAADYLRQNAPQSAHACEACAWLTAIAMLELRGKS